MKKILITLAILIAMVNKTDAQEYFENNRITPRLCYVTLEDGNTYKIKNYSMQTLHNRAYFREETLVQYVDYDRDKTILKHDYVLVKLKQGLYKKIKFADIEKLTLTCVKSEYSKCEKILLTTDSIINGIYPKEGIKLDCSHYYFLVTKENGEKLEIKSNWLSKIEKDINNKEKWNITYKQERLYIDEPDYDTVIVSVTNIEWATKKSIDISTIKKYGENEEINILNVIDLEDDQETKQVTKIKFTDIASIDFYTSGKREVTFLDGTKLNCEFKEEIKYFYGDIDDDLIIFIPIIWGSLKSIKFVK